MDFSINFIITNMLLGVGLAMDAFSVSLANGLNEPSMGSGKMSLIAGTYGVFQAVMPMTGWLCVHTVLSYFSAFEEFIPVIALALLLYIGGGMLKEGLRGSEEEEEFKGLSMGTLMLQGIATSIDALSVGFTIADLSWQAAAEASVIIAAVTFVICTAGLVMGKKMGTGLGGKASVLGGVILIAIGFKIFISSLF